MNEELKPPHRSGGTAAAVELAAATWLARRDRGLSENERLEFAHWNSDAGNARALRELESTFHALDRAAQLRPLDAAAIDPDLLMAKSAREYRLGGSSRGVTTRRLAWIAASGAAAAGLILAFSLFLKPRRLDSVAAAPRVVVRHEPQRLALSDGSTVDLNRGAEVKTFFTAHERRVSLPSGDAFFAVAKDPARPFIVMVGKVEVRAVGTAFTVRASSAAVEVVVTEGRVRVDDTAGQNLIAQTEPAAPSSVRNAPQPADLPAMDLALDAGQKVVIPVAPAGPQPVSATVATSADLERATAWRGVWLEFGDLPLQKVVDEFNSHAGPSATAVLKVSDEATGRVLVSGTFRADGAEAFVRLLESTFGISTRRTTDGTIWLQKVE